MDEYDIDLDIYIYYIEFIYFVNRYNCFNVYIWELDEYISFN